jgi:Spy/CpxP family protein refolding chaperone
MRRATVMGIAALAAVLALATAVAQTTDRSPARARGAKAPPATSPSTPTRTPVPGGIDDRRGMPGSVPELEGEDDGMERMDGPDAWDLMDMGPAGLKVPGSGRGIAAERMRSMMARRAEVARQLALTDAQRDRIEAIRERQRRTAIEQRARLQLARLDLRSLLRADVVDRSAMEAKVDELSRLEAQARKARIQSMLEVRSVLTAEQRKKLRALRTQWGASGEI